MLLEELFAMLPEDYGQLTDPPNNLPSFNPTFSKVVGTFDNNDVWGSRELGTLYDIYGFKDPTGIVIAYIIIETKTQNGIQKLREVWANPQFRGKGLATGLLMFVLRKLGIKLLITQDEPLSDDARSFILKGLQNSKFTAVTPNHQPIDIKDAQTMLNTLGKTNDEMILEGHKIPFPIFNIPKNVNNNKLYVGANYVIGTSQTLD